MVLSAWQALQERFGEDSARDEFSQNAPSIGRGPQFRFTQPRAVRDGDKAKRDMLVNHAGKHFGLDFKGLTVELKLVDGAPAEGPITRAYVGCAGSKQSRSEPGQQVIAHKIESRHCVGFNLAVQSVTDDHLM